MGQLKDSNDKSTTIVELNKNKGDVKFLYLYEQETPADMPANDSLMAEMKKSMAAMFGSGNISIRINFPYEVTSSNATSTEGNTLIWSYPISEIFMTSSMKLEASMKDEWQDR